MYQICYTIVSMIKMNNNNNHIFEYVTKIDINKKTSMYETNKCMTLAMELSKYANTQYV